MKRTVVVLASVLLVVTAGCLEPFQGAGVKVAVVGDSITADATPELHAALADYQRSITGEPGIDLADGLEQLVAPAVAAAPDVLVVELGINSALNGWVWAEDLPVLEDVLAELDDAECVVWVTPNALAPSYYDSFGPGSLRDRVSAFQASLRKRLPAHPNQHLADWSVEQAANVTWYHADRLHHSPAGDAAYAAFVERSVAAYC